LIRVSTDLFKELLDSLSDQIAVVDARGRIVYVNESWIRFGEENGQPLAKAWLGTNDLGVCATSAESGDTVVDVALAGIKDVLGCRKAAFIINIPATV
jgi:hypothetical protein